MMPFSLVSSAFTNGDLIPVKFTADGDDVSPALSWSDPPPKTDSFALVLKDCNVKEKGIHWILWNLPATTHALPEAIPNVPELRDGSRQGKNDFNKIGFSGPRLARVTEHRYEFTLYALDSKLALKAGSSYAELTALMGGHAGHILEETQLVGRFKPRRDDARLRDLESDKDYVYQSDGIKRRLEEAYNARPKEVMPSAFAAGKIREFMKTLDDDAVRVSLEEYVKFANRFRVQFRLRTNPLRFKTLLQTAYGEKFHVKIVGDHFEPGKPAPVSEDESFRDFFRADNLKILDEAQELVDKGKATFTQIDDGPGYSLLKDLEMFAYKDDGVAFFVHNAEQPYLGCIFGEKITKQLLHDMGKTVTEFQKKHFFRTSGGRPPDMERVKKTLEVDKEPISNKAKAAELAEGGDEKKVKNQEVKLSRMRRSRRESKR
jgi:Raf kinase inhibitor-like YbhB/YbcL family protein